MSDRAWVLLHGFAGGTASWQSVVEPLLAAGRPLCLEIIGHQATGNAEYPDENWPADFDGELDRLAAEVERHGLPAAHLVGYSLGARLALGLLLRHRRLFRRATLIGVHPGLTGAAERQQRAEADEGWAERLEREGGEAFFAAWEAQPLFTSQRRLALEAQARQRELRSRLDPFRLARAMRLLSLARMPAYGLRLAELDLPIDLVVGEEDEKFRRLADEMATVLPDGTVTVVPGVGHNVVLEAPEVLAGNLLVPRTAAISEAGAEAG